MMFLAPLRWLLISLNNVELFYYTAGIVFDRLNTSEYYQSARDFCEEIIISSFNDGIPEQGFFNSFRCYSAQSSIHAAILYANLSLFSIITSKRNISDKFIYDVIWQSIMYFRNTKFYPWAIDIYNNIPKDIKLNDYERRAIDHSYFICLLLMKDNTISDKLLDYLNIERESILSGGHVEAAPWLITLYNIKRINKDFSKSGLEFYLNLFESIVPSQIVDKQRNIILGDSEPLKIYLKESIFKLTQTRNKSDILYDNEMAIKIASRLIADSFVKQDEEAILLAMMVKSDFSLIFQSKVAEGLSLFRLQVLSNNEFDIESLSKSNIWSSLHPKDTDFFIWIAVSEGEVFQLSMIGEKFEFYSITNWDWDVYKKLTNLNFFANIKFDDTIKDKGGVRNILPEEHIQEGEIIAYNLNFSKLFIDSNAESVMLIKDMELAKFPHNLILDSDGNFLHLSKPITNILSTEWYISHKDDKLINGDFSKSIWIPTQGGDFTLNQLFSTLEDYLITNNYNVFEEINLEKPISSKLNIICSHGDKNIAETQFIYPNDDPLIDTNRIIGEGDILIFFVCHSGSYQNDFFRNNITSIVKNYISRGYKAVIAPFWSLHIYIPNIWLPTFISSLKHGQSVDRAVFQANQAVYGIYQTPAAWACMHLYGNPHITIAN